MKNFNAQLKILKLYTQYKDIRKFIVSVIIVEHAFYIQQIRKLTT